MLLGKIIGLKGKKLECDDVDITNCAENVEQSLGKRHTELDNTTSVQMWRESMKQSCPNLDRDKALDIFRPAAVCFPR